MVIAKVKSGGASREGRGFSIGEILGAGVALSKAAELKLRVDRRRKSAHSFNIEELKKIMNLSEKKGEGKTKKATASKKTEKKK